MATLEQKLQRPPCDEEIADLLQLSLADYRQLLNEVNGYALISLDEISGGAWVVDDDAQTSPGLHLENVEIKGLLGGAIDKLPEKERLVVALYYYEGLTLKEIGLTMELTEGRISQLHTKAILRLRGALSRKKSLLL